MKIAFKATITSHTQKTYEKDHSKKGRLILSYDIYPTGRENTDKTVDILNKLNQANQTLAVLIAPIDPETSIEDIIG